VFVVVGFGFMCVFVRCVFGFFWVVVVVGGGGGGGLLPYKRDRDACSQTWGCKLLILV